MRVPVSILNPILRRTEQRYLARVTSVPEARARFERQARAAFVKPPMTRYRKEVIGGVPAIRALAGSPASDAAILYMHGGGFCLGSAQTHCRLGGTLSALTGVPVVLPDYRLAPDHPHPAAIDDVLAAYRALLDSGLAPHRIALAGDSAGGTLALSLLQRIPAAGLGQPAASVLFSPLTDLTYSGASITQNAATEVLLPPNRLEEVRSWYLGDQDPADPMISPLFGEFQGAGPVQMQASLAEMLLDDTLRMANRLTAQGVTVEVKTWDRTPHVWQIFHGILAEADEAVDAAAAFLRAHLTKD